MGILTARTPTINLAALEVSKCRRVSTFWGYIRLPHRRKLDSGISVASLRFHIPTWIIKKKIKKEGKIVKDSCPGKLKRNHERIDQ